LQEADRVLGIIEPLTDEATAARGGPEASAALLLLRLLLNLDPRRDIDNRGRS